MLTVKGLRWQLAYAAALMGSVAVLSGCTAGESSRDAKGNERIASAAGRVEIEQTCLTIQRATGGTVDDSQIASGDPVRLAKNYGGSWTGNAGIVDGGPRQFLVRFDIGAIPTGSAVVSATATLSQINDAAATVRVHAITSPFLESSVTWTAFGGAYDPAVIASFPNGGPSYAGPVSADITALAQAWVNGLSQNHGILLEQDPVGATRFWTSDDPDATEQPKLQICWAAPTCGDGIQDQGERGVDCGGPCPADCPHPPATSMVSAGDRASSTHYSVVYTFGQPTQNQDKATSPSYRVQGGLIGANGSLP